MQEHISIGRVFAGAWRLFRRRYIAMFLLSLVQNSWIFIPGFRLPYPGGYSVIPVKSHLIPEIGFEAWAIAAVLFLLGSMGITVMCEDRIAQADVRGTFFYRIPSALIDAAACFGLLYITLEAASRVHLLDGYLYSALFPLFIVASFLLFIMANFIVPPMIFVTFPVSVVEGGWPLRAIGRSFRLTQGERWRVFAVILILRVIYVAVASTYYSIIYSEPWQALSANVLFYKTVKPGLLCALICPFTLTVILIMVSAYQELIRLKEGTICCKVK